MGEIADLIRRKNPHNIAGFFRKATVTQNDDGSMTVTEEREDAELINGVWVPEGVLLLEPRTLYDSTLIGVARQGGVHFAVYSEKLARQATIEASVEDAAAVARDGGEPDPDADPEVDGYEHFDFNVSGSIGVGFPVFILDEDEA